MANSDYKNPKANKKIFSDFDKSVGSRINSQFGNQQFRSRNRMLSTEPFGQSFSDPSTLLANNLEYYIQVEYIHGHPDVRYVNFKGFIIDYSDNFSSTWNTEEVYGRNDPIHTFQSTKRSITLAWEVPAASVMEAKQNLAKASKMMRFLYPSYTGENNVSTLTKPPLLRLRFTNLLKRDSSLGLLGKANGFSFLPDLDAGWFEIGPGEVYPKLLTFSMDFDVLHETHLGWHDCSGYWERNCKESTGRDCAAPPEKVSWPYLSINESANAVQENPYAAKYGGRPELRSQRQFEEFQEQYNEKVFEEVARQLAPAAIRRLVPVRRNSKVATQGVIKSEELQKQEKTDPTERDQVLSPPPIKRPSEREKSEIETLLGSVK